MSDPIKRVVIVGGGPTAVRCALALRAHGYDGRIALFAEEDTLPYDRTFVSKDLLSLTQPSPPDTWLEPAETYETNDIEVHLGLAAASLDWRSRRVRLCDGREEAYDRVVVATGGRPRRLAIRGTARALYLRTRHDAGELARVLDAGRDLVIVGAGFIGGEVASAARERGVHVTMIDTLPVPLLRALGRDVGARMAALHRANDVRLVLNRGVVGMKRRGVSAEVHVQGGERVSGAAVLVAVGMRPATEWLTGSEIAVRGHVRTDQYCQTAIPGVFAAGDAASWFDPRWGRYVAFEHWDTAQRHGDTAAANVLGERAPFRPLPFFWSDQHGVKLQMVGNPTTHDEVLLEDFDPPRSFVAQYFANGQHTATFAANQPQAIASARRKLAAVAGLVEA